MAEKKNKVQAVRVDYACDNCKQGIMKYTGKQTYLGVVMFEHQCLLCGFRKNLPKQYPVIDFEDVE